MLRPGDRIGVYEVLGPLGAGGMGEVYRARDPRLDRVVALKVLRGEVSPDPERVARFGREARAASATNHPNILTVHDVGLHGGAPFLVTELLEGQTLRALFSRGPLPAPRVVELGAQVARGLAAAHGKGVVHRDLKPENLFLANDGTVKILDFGLARQEGPAGGSHDQSMAETAERLTEAGTVVGTAGYMSPEQARGEKVDTRSDVFSLGSVLYEGLSGRQAFRKASIVETLGAVLSEEPPPLPPGTVSPALEHVVKRCMEKRPEARFQSASDLAFALEEAVPRGGPPSPGARPSRSPSRPLLAILGALFFVIVLVVGALVVRRLPRGADRTTPGAGATRIDSLAVLPLSNFSGDASQEFFADGMTEALIAELAKLKALKVISRTSVMSYKGTKRPMKEIATELGVRGVVEGSVQRDAGTVRVTVQLIDGTDDRHLWAESYTREARDVLKLQSEVARAIAREIRVAVSPEEARRLAAAKSVDPVAHELLLQGAAMGSGGDSQREAGERVLALYRQAVERAPDYARAHAALAGALAVVGANGYGNMTDACAAARAELTRALELDPADGEALAFSGHLRMRCDLDWAGADREIRRAAELSPGSAAVLTYQGWFLSAVGRHDEAIESARRAAGLDPLNQWRTGYVGTRLYEARRYDEAAAHLGKMLDVWPDSLFGKWLLGRVRTAQGRYDEALAVLLTRKVARPDMNFVAGLAQGLAGHRREAREVLEYLLEKRRKSFVPTDQIAAVYLGLGDRASAMEWLERSYEERSMFLEFFKVDPMWDPLRREPRFESLLARMKYPDGSESSARPPIK